VTSPTDNGMKVTARRCRCVDQTRCASRRITNVGQLIDSSDIALFMLAVHDQYPALQ